MDTYNQEILTELEHNLVQASSGKRLANYLIDLVLYYVLIFLIFLVIAYINPQSVDDDSNLTNSSLLDRILFLIFYGLYLFVVEAIFKGKSLGKLITRTRAVNYNGSTLTIKAALLRGLSRAVPFDNFSALGSPSYPWHDKWSDTYVIDEAKSTIILN